MTELSIQLVEGNLLNQDVEVIVNTWNRNIIPWWLLLPQGVSGQIKKYGGYRPFKEVRRHGAIALGGAVLTSSGDLPFKGIIHVAGINFFWRASEISIRGSVKNTIKIVNEQNFASVAFPIIGAGSGGFRKKDAKNMMLDELCHLKTTAKIVIVDYNNQPYSGFPPSRE